MLERYVQAVLSSIDDVDREGLKETPARVKRFYDNWLTKGEPQFRVTQFENEGMNEMIVQKHIPFYSLCEHHMLPFFGTASVAYIPLCKIVGLSKLARIVDWYARRLQNQERMTKQIADFLQSQLQPQGVAVITTARHMCMEMRGVKVKGAETSCSSLQGAFATQGNARSEFLNIINFEGA